ncbi:MAG TPA: asparagine synthase (glutamine-hydrolyzing) [Burkholderiaceae bacterium]|nr:asparagine synthase (glutamine-hydrolyzing) [Burkholderiaceae bacterium]
MCGIAGYFGTFDRGLLASMNAAIAHRGPDGEGSYFAANASVGLTHRRLAIIDLSPTGAQPMTDASTGVTLTYNGEIYNYRELRAQLEGAGTTFFGHSDTEVILRLYLERGRAALPLLNGIFAFALWDPRDRSLLVVRDGPGIKPLYYAQPKGGFLFASELKALLECGAVERTIDPRAAWLHLTYLWAPTPYTMLASVRKLEPGTALLVRDGTIVERWRYYELPYPTPAFQGGVDAAAGAVREALDTSVRRQMVADVPVGAFLSGGLDSSSIVAYARKHAPGQRIQCFTIETTTSASGEGFVDDLPYARAVARHLDVDLHTIRVGPEIVDQFERMVWHLDEPQADLAPLNALMICQLAREHGIKVLLSGAGGDDIFTGYRRHYALRQERLWSWLPASARRLLGTAARTLPASPPSLRRVRRALGDAALDGDERLVSYFTWLPRADSASLLAPGVRAQIGDWVPALPLLDSLQAIPGEPDRLNRMLFLEARHFLCDHNLNYTDKMGMAVGVEVRVPFLDPDLMRLAASLPAPLKQHGREGKWILKRAMEPVLPRDVIYRPKTGFGVPLRRWLRHELRETVADLLSERSLAARGLFDAHAVGRLRQLDAAGRIDAAYPLLALCAIELWCRLFIDKKN